MTFSGATPTRELLFLLEGFAFNVLFMGLPEQAGRRKEPAVRWASQLRPGGLGSRQGLVSDSVVSAGAAGQARAVGKRLRSRTAGHLLGTGCRQHTLSCLLSCLSLFSLAAKLCL